MRYTFKIGEELVKVAPRSLADELILAIGEQDCRVVFDHGREGRCTLTLDGRSYESWVARDGDDIYLKMAGHYFKVTAIDPRAAAAGASAGAGAISAPMPGVVVEVLVAEGDIVVEGDKLLTIESMKLQSTVRAACDGVVGRIHVSEGSEFNKDDVLVEIESDD
ncbi:acetyl-CoA carboxylase biotin carboxyl carrier protein subunit [Zhongshania aliphaticivorans]|uniref:acetyl-CoA carboxylase biotin carboxyl carrier protein subunit n=1 Tax=Zhongshania aliphaticivorans TaxID=1470434 RepID=UPI0012E45BDB|nr:acetyl-CoA carboxylase biotin carboxyl carrier protein subunit [Zhongshania aliphaticivorans]CAA0091346.1 2-oxoglutarate carboxylase large subunit [Zhongshania aliphaticivorans]